MLIDVGLPGTLGKMNHQFRKYGISLNEIKHMIVTHFHPDHCGIVRDLQQMGVKWIVGKPQLEHLRAANERLAAFPGFKEMIVNPSTVIEIHDKVSFLKKIVMPGYMVHTPGHSEDSISIVVEGVGVFTGDLPPMNPNGTEKDGIIEQSWTRIRETKESTVFPGHGSSFRL